MISDLIKGIQDELGDFTEQMNQVSRDIEEAQRFLATIKPIGPVDLSIQTENEGVVTMTFDRPNEKLMVGKNVMLHMKFEERVKYHKHLPDFLRLVKEAATEFKKTLPPVTSKQPSAARRNTLDPVEPGDDKWNKVTTKKTKGMY